MPRAAKTRSRDTVTPETLELMAVLRALADPVRLELVRQLRKSNGPVACGAFEVAVAKNTLSHHFRTLREAGVIATHHQGTTALNVLQEDELDAAFPGLLDAILPRRR